MFLHISVLQPATAHCCFAGLLAVSDSSSDQWTSPAPAYSSVIGPLAVIADESVRPQPAGGFER